ncbi:MAG: hypothetical protein AAGF85_15800 [Bacteroidota bacterium]
MKLNKRILIGILSSISIHLTLAQEQFGQDQPSSDPSLPEPIIAFMGSDDQHPFGKKNDRMPEELQQFGQLIGVWKMTSHAFYQEKWYSGWPSYWAWKYALDGTVVLDYFYQSKEDFPPVVPKNYDTHGMNVRVYDQDTDSWKITWVSNSGPESRISAKYINQEIHMKSMGQDSTQWRIIFSEITQDSFKWRQESRSESGDWTFQQYLTGVRIK